MAEPEMKSGFDREGSVDHWIEVDQRSVLHQWTSNQQYEPELVVRAEGNYFWTAAGNRILDFTSQAFFANIGHCDSRVIEALHRQARSMSGLFSRATPVRSQLAEYLVSLLPAYARVYFGTNGSDAVEIALKTARAITGRQRVISFFGSYHGTTSAASSVSGEYRTRLGGGQPLAGSIFVPPPYRYRSPFLGESQEETDERTVAFIRETIHETGAETIAAFIAEPCLTAGAGVVPGRSFWRDVRELCDENGILLIADEVITGFGRTGSWFAHPAYDYVPDIVVLGKGLASGYAPISATLFSPATAEFYDDIEVPFGLTHSGHPLGCAAAVAVIDVISGDGLIERATQMGTQLVMGLEALQDAHPSLGDVRASGLFATLEFVRDPVSRTSFGLHDTIDGLPQGEPGAGMAVARYLTQAGVLVRPTSDLLKLGPPLTVEAFEIDLVLELLDQALTVLDTYCQA